MRHDFREYVRTFERYASLGTLETIAMLDEPGGPYPLLSLTVPGSRTLVITAGFHGEEPAPPLTLLHHMEEIVAHARAHDVGLHVVPCVNPSGFEDGTRYNRSGERPNNDFIRYELQDGRVVGELEHDTPFHRWRLHDEGPKETRALRTYLHRFPTPVAALDLHQDRYLDGTHTYAYVFGRRETFHPIVAHARRHVPAVAGYHADERRITDEHGLVEHHDGSITDYYRRRGVAHAACVETTTKTPLDACHQVNLAWIRGFIELTRATPEEHLPRPNTPDSDRPASRDTSPDRPR